mmetsp:Transcript_15486/g.22540  ORF Transcript_15486/g.22540 Transcript_15486/m.22540 type:complete len:273 (+) Transcript_15486:86-904(+)
MKTSFQTLALLAISSQCNAFSATSTASPALFAGFDLPAPIAKFQEGLQRKNLKKQLIEAAESKNESLVLSLVDELALLNPTPIPTLGMMGYGLDDTTSNGSIVAPLEGKWKLLYTNARDAEAPARTQKDSSDETFGESVAEGIEVKTGQRIDASSGNCINYIQLDGEESENNNKKRPFDLLEITIKMTPMNEKRIRLDFIKGRALNDNAPLEFLKDFTFNFPPPAFGDLLARIRGLDPSVDPQAYFDILYIDDEVRAHRTGEGKIFVQKRDN